MGHLDRKGKRKKGKTFQSNQKQRRENKAMHKKYKTAYIMQREVSWESQAVFEFDVVIIVKPFRDFE